MTKNAYIHIPFCKQKCNYCSFVSFVSQNKQAEYVNAICNEIKYRYKGELLDTLYFGGGTPSLLSIEEIKQILEHLNFNQNTEVTFEANPETLTVEYLEELKKLGINRLSLGCQTFNPDILNIIGRKHSPQDVIQTVKIAQNIGFNNINLDFIYGLPTQTIEEFSSDLRKAASLGIQHISLYGLKIDEGCVFYKKMPANLPDSDTQADMYLKAIEVLTSLGFEHYEISNFSKNSFESKHNLNYWNNNSYYGFGVAAHGYENGTRYSNTTNIKKYLENPHEHAFENKLTEQEKLEEAIFLGFRKMNGINIQTINSKYGINFDNKYKNIIQKYTQTGHILKTQNGYKLSDTGILVSNYILSDFLD